jgi:hypothetical protein
MKSSRLSVAVKSPDTHSLATNYRLLLSGPIKPMATARRHRLTAASKTGAMLILPNALLCENRGLPLPVAPDDPLGQGPCR